MDKWNVNEMMEVLGIKTSLGPTNEFVIDDRKVQKGDIFIGIKGNNYDGSNFATSALKNGAKYCITNKEPELIEIAPKDREEIKLQKFLILEDTKSALVKLCEYTRNVRQSQAKYIGITGSVGKTTTKEMLGLVLSGTGKCYSSVGNFNSQIGLPLCMANIDHESYDSIVLEMGMSEKGGISKLTNLVKPHIGIITHIAPAHLLYFPSLYAIALAKAEIIEGISEFLVLNLDCPFSNTIIEIAHQKCLKVMGYSIENKSQEKIFCKIRAKQVDEFKEGEDIRSRIGCNYKYDDGESCDFSYIINGVGLDLVLNSLAVLGVLLSNGKDIAHMSRLQEFRAVDGRGSVESLPNLKIKLINETYNCNPTSLEAALGRMPLLCRHEPEYRMLAVLGDMLELSEEEIKFHKEVKSSIKLNKISKVFCVGKLMKYLYEELDEDLKGGWCLTSKEMIDLLVPAIKENDIIMVKGSNSMKMIEIVLAIKKMESYD